jgi:hypothetical protein
MIQNPEIEELNYSILHEEIGEQAFRGLCSAIVYGPNASGKSNIIGAMDTFKSVVLRGHIRNVSGTSLNHASYFLGLIPNRLDADHKPIDFYIKFIENGYLIEYGFSADIGGFMASDYPRKILDEELKVNGSLIFSRGSQLVFGSFKTINDLMKSDFELGNVETAKGSLLDNELFLLNGFKTLYSHKLVYIITNWLENKLVVLYKADIAKSAIFPTYLENKPYISEIELSNAANNFGAAMNSFGVTQLVSVFKKDNDETKYAILSEVFESSGTKRYINLLPFVLNAFGNGGTLVADEFDSSIHFMAILSLLACFHNDDINVNKAQLIFNTHNPIYMNNIMARRDEIKFIDWDEKELTSYHYTLSDFSDATENVRQDFLTNYFYGQYGGIRCVDLSPTYEKFTAREKEV